MSPARPETKNNCAGETQQHFTRPTKDINPEDGNCNVCRNGWKLSTLYTAYSRMPIDTLYVTMTERCKQLELLANAHLYSNPVPFSLGRKFKLNLLKKVSDKCFSIKLSSSVLLF